MSEFNIPIPHTIYKTESNERVFIGCIAPTGWYVAFVDEGHNKTSVDILGAQFMLWGMIYVDDEGNVNPAGFDLRPIDGRAERIYNMDINKIEYLAGEKLRSSFKSWMEDNLDMYKLLEEKVANHIGQIIKDIKNATTHRNN